MSTSMLSVTTVEDWAACFWVPETKSVLQFYITTMDLVTTSRQLPDFVSRAVGRMLFESSEQGKVPSGGNFARPSVSP